MTRVKQIRRKTEIDLKPVLAVARPLPRVKQPHRSASAPQHRPSAPVQLHPKKVSQQDVLNCTETMRALEAAAIHTLATLSDRSQMLNRHTLRPPILTLSTTFQVRHVSAEEMRNISFIENPVDNALLDFQRLSVHEQQAAQTTPSFRVIYRRGQINEENEDDLYN